MGRAARIVIPGIPHHVTLRGNDRLPVFFDDDDRLRFMGILRKKCGRHGVEITGYCLMTNHVHLIAVPEGPQSLAKGIGGTGDLYARYLNEKRDRRGHLWENRYFSIPMDDAYTVFAVRYIERNPVAARMVTAATDHVWSSARAHCGEPDRSGLLDTAGWADRYPPEAWAKLLGLPDDEDMRKEMQSRRSSGRPLGSDAFVERLEAALGRSLRPKRLGRPRGSVRRRPPNEK